MRGEIGEAEKRSKAKQEISKIDAETAVLETQRLGDKAQADARLTNRKTELDMNIQLAKISAQRQAEMKDAELQKGVETLRAETELERLRATDVTKSQIEREVAAQSAEGKYYRQVKDADASNYTKKKDADSQQYHKKLESDALCK